MAGGGAEDFVALGIDAFEVVGLATEGFGLCAGFFCIDFFGALPLPLASVEAFVTLLNSSTAFLSCYASLA